MFVYRAKELKGWEKYGKVFVGPDRTREERVVRKGLVQELKNLREKEPDKNYVIRQNVVILKQPEE